MAGRTTATAAGAEGAQPRTRHRPTQSDVAKLAGVSVSIVSAVINDRQYGNIRISDGTRARVRDAVRELGYAPNLAARGLAGGTNHLIGVFTFQRIFPLTKEDFFYEFLVGIEEAAEHEGYNLLLLTAAKDRAETAASETAASAPVSSRRRRVNCPETAIVSSFDGHAGRR